MEPKEKIAKALEKVANRIHPTEIIALTRLYANDLATVIQPIIKELEQNLQIDLQMANDTIADCQGEIAELKSKLEHFNFTGGGR